MKVWEESLGNSVCHDAEVEMMRQMTAIIEREGDSYIALCPEPGHRKSRRKRV